MRITDKELETELNIAKFHLNNATMRKSPPKVIQRCEVDVEILEELLLWRQNGRKWLNFMNSQPNSLSDSMFAGRENGQILKPSQRVNKING